MRIADFNALTEREAANAVGPCVAIDSFVDTVVSGRPYADLDSLLAHAAAQTDEWTDSEVEHALAAQPPAGERVAGGGLSARLGRKEHAGLDREDAVLLARLREATARYEARFGHAYVVRAAGRTPEQLLALVEKRLDHDRATELRTAKEQLGEIALLRLQGLFESSGGVVG